MSEAGSLAEKAALTEDMPDDEDAIQNKHEFSLSLSLDKMHASPSEYGDLLELFFFAYREFTQGPDEVLTRYGLGRAHHRVLHFVSRKPGLSVAELLEILRITKQSLARVLKQLIEENCIDSRQGLVDKRQRLLYLTSKGQELVSTLRSLQETRLTKALERLEASLASQVNQTQDIDALELVRSFFLGVMTKDERKHISRILPLNDFQNMDDLQNVNIPENEGKVDG